MVEFIVIETTFPSKVESENICRQLLQVKLAACIQLTGPIESTYLWQGKIETSQEWRCSIKAKSSNLDEISELLHKLHPYDVPEFVVFDITQTSPKYAAWLRGNLEN